MVLQCAALFAIFLALQSENEVFEWSRFMLVWAMLVATVLSGLQVFVEGICVIAEGHTSPRAARGFPKPCLRRAGLFEQSGVRYMLGFAIVGCGMIARFHARALAEMPGTQVVALVSRSDRERPEDERRVEAALRLVDRSGGRS